MRIIISGVPCCGKTHFGDWLRDQHAFAHANLEARVVQPPPPICPPDMSDNLPRWLALLATDVVVTWGFPPNPYCLDKITRFQDAGFTPRWFAAEHEVARARYVALYGEQAAQVSFDPQIQRLLQAQAELTAIYQNHSIEALTADGYTPVVEIYDTIAANTD
jgi:hypothetical protein